MARAALRDDLAAEQAELAVEVLAGRGSGGDAASADAAGLVGAWVDGWDATQRRAAAQLADIAAGERHELPELVVAVRTLRGLRGR
jgi:glutamate dehydrogenase